MPIPRISFRNLSKNKVVVFDYVGSQVLKTIVLNDIKYTIIHSRMEIIHITPPLLYLMIRNATKFIKQRSLNLEGVKKSRLRGCIYKIYLFSCIDYINPRVVITFIDNSYYFHWISRMYENCKFYAIQNGMRFDANRRHYDEQNDVWEGSGSQTGVMSMPNLFCFGAYEADLYKKHGHVVDNFYPVGSLKGVFYKTRISVKSAEDDFDICVVSSGCMSLPEGHKLSKLALATGYFYKWVNKYVTERRLSYCVAMQSTDKHDQEIEKECLVNIFGDRATIIEQNEKDLFTTYVAMDRSSVVVAFCSTTAFEAFGWGKKILLCEPGGDDYWRSPLPKICTLSVNDYETFRRKLDYLRELDESEYRELIQAHARYFMNYDFNNPAHVVIRKMILEDLNQSLV